MHCLLYSLLLRSPGVRHAAGSLRWFVVPFTPSMVLNSVTVPTPPRSHSYADGVVVGEGTNERRRYASPPHGMSQYTSTLPGCSRGPSKGQTCGLLICLAHLSCIHLTWVGVVASLCLACPSTYSQLVRASHFSARPTVFSKQQRSCCCHLSDPRPPTGGLMVLSTRKGHCTLCKAESSAAHGQQARTGKQ